MTELEGKFYNIPYSRSLGDGGQRIRVQGHPLVQPYLMGASMAIKPAQLFDKEPAKQSPVTQPLSCGLSFFMISTCVTVGAFNILQLEILD